MILTRWIKSRSLSDDPEDFRLSIVEHLDELRIRIIRSLVLLVVGWIAGWFLFDWIFPIFQAHVRDMIPKDVSYKEVFTDFMGPFFLKLKLSFVLGFVLVGPLVITQIWGFIKPGLRPRERRPFQVIGPLSVFLFALGCYFCWLILPTTISWFVVFAHEAFPDTEILQEAGRLIFFVVNMMLAFGIAFQLPLIVFFLAFIGLLPPATISQYWRHATVVIFVFSAIITPSVDPVSMLMMAIPLCILFILSVLAVKMIPGRSGTPELEPGVLTD